MLILLFGETSWPSNVAYLNHTYFVNIFYLFFYHSTHYAPIHFWELCAVSLTHSLRLFKPHLARHKYIISHHLHWMPFKLESFSRETTCILATVISTVSVRMAVTSLPAPLAIIGSARNRQDVRLTDPGRSCEKSADSDHRPVNRCISNLIHYALISLSFVLWTSLRGLRSAVPSCFDSLLLQAHHSAHGMLISA